MDHPSPLHPAQTSSYVADMVQWAGHTRNHKMPEAGTPGDPMAAYAARCILQSHVSGFAQAAPVTDICILHQVASDTAGSHCASGHQVWVGASSQGMQLERGGAVPSS